MRGGQAVFCCFSFCHTCFLFFLHPRVLIPNSPFSHLSSARAILVNCKSLLAFVNKNPLMLNPDDDDDDNIFAVAHLNVLSNRRSQGASQPSTHIPSLSSTIRASSTSTSTCNHDVQGTRTEKVPEPKVIKCQSDDLNDANAGKHVNMADKKTQKSVKEVKRKSNPKPKLTQLLTPFNQRLRKLPFSHLMTRC